MVVILAQSGQWLLNADVTKSIFGVILRLFMRKNDESHDFITGLLTSYYY